MKKQIRAFMLAAVMVGFAFTGAFAEGPPDSREKPGVSVGESVTAPEGPGQKPGAAPRDMARDQAARKERDVAVRDFQKAVHDAERKFNASEKAASKLQGEERRTAVQKAAAEMKASIKQAEEKKDATLEKLGQGRKKPPQHTERVKKDIDAGQVSVEQEAEQTDVQPQPGTSLPDRQKN